MYTCYWSDVLNGIIEICGTCFIVKSFDDIHYPQTNVKNNNNKFYIIQLLEDDGSKKYNVWFRWGRGIYSNAAVVLLYISMHERLFIIQ